LPDRSRDRFAQLPPGEQVERFLTWMRQYTTCRGAVTKDDLEEFFAEELDLKTQAQLLSLPPGEMEQALRLMYRCPKNIGGVQVRWPWAAGGLAAPAPLAGGEAEAADDAAVEPNRNQVGGSDGGRGRDDRDRRGDGRRGDGPDRDGRRGPPPGRPRDFRPPPDFGGVPLGPSEPRRNWDGPMPGEPRHPN
jgi:hypothetical protein